MQPAAFRIFGGTFTIRWGPTVMTAFMLAVLIGLGTWQVQRLHWKENLIATIKARMQEAPLDLSPAAAVATKDMEYRPAKASGLFQHDKELYLAAISLKGDGGYHILTPLQLDNGRYLLVDRGWVPYDHKLPATRQDGELAGPVTVTGILRLPSGHRWMQPANDSVRNDWYWFDLPAMARAAGVPPLLPYVLEADATSNPGGYPVGGQTRITLPNNHFTYALTWYALALALLIIYGIYGWRRGD